MLRFILRRVNTGAAANVLDAPAEIDYDTIDADVPELETALTLTRGYESVSLLGVEVLVEVLPEVEGE